MKSIKKLTSVLSVTIIIFIGFACQNNNDTSDQNTGEDKYQTELPLIYHMAYLDRFTTKLYFAGQEENWELADIYAHEIEEISSMIINGEYTDEDINRSELLEVMLLPQIEMIEQAIDAKDPDLFADNYQTLINTCNQCHSAAKYGLIQITVPTDNPYNQDFSKPDYSN